MYTIKENISNTIEIKHSKFITNIYNINSMEEIHDILETLKKEHKDATHHTYAYIFNNQEKVFDDNEPKGTAGLPILNILKKNNMINTLCVVIRYFGGIKLGAGGLIRAYSTSCNKALKLANKEQYVETKELTISFNYENENRILDIIKTFQIKNKKYKENITYTIDIPITIYDETIKKLDQYLI